MTSPATLPDMTRRIAMWSGPRNLSTALMYAFGNRADCHAIDEPFYAAYLAATGLDHPLRHRVLASQPTDPAVVSRTLAADTSAPLIYQKHMVHHILPDMPLDWLSSAAHVVLIRHPARVAASYLAKRENPTADDLGFEALARIFDTVSARTARPLIIDSADIRAAPAPMLRSLCAALELPFDPAMLSWPAGPKPFDGAWAPHWYDAVHRSTGFAGPEGPAPVITGATAALVEAALPTYERFRALRLSAGFGPPEASV